MDAKRDTDADWRELGATQPFWGVLTHPNYLAENLTPQAIEDFYGTGVHYIDDVARRLRQFTGIMPSGRALDFGCGVGRLAEAMAAICETTGYDISPGMLAKARARGGKANYVGELPDGPFDWINSFIVFQHIPPERGMVLLKSLLDRLSPGGHVSLQLTFWREPHLFPAPPTQVRGWLRKLRAKTAPPIPVGLISMYDYDLSQILRLFNLAGIEEVSLVSTDHAGHHGAILLGRRTPA
jgi:SAM-dependent methyltransferase